MPYLMQALDDTDSTVHRWVSDSLDWPGNDYSGPNSPVASSVAVYGTVGTSTVNPALGTVLGVGNSAGSRQIKGLLDPTDPQDAATQSSSQAYTDEAANALLEGVFDYETGEIEGAAYHDHLIDLEDYASIGYDDQAPVVMFRVQVLATNSYWDSDGNGGKYITATIGSGYVSIESSFGGNLATQPVITCEPVTDTTFNLRITNPAGGAIKARVRGIGVGIDAPTELPE